MGNQSDRFLGGFLAGDVFSLQKISLLVLGVAIGLLLVFLIGYHPIQSNFPPSEASPVPPTLQPLPSKYGFIDQTGQMVIPPRFTEATTFAEGLAAVKINGMWGYLDRTGKLVIPAQFSSAWEFSQGIARVGDEQAFGYINKTGQYIAKPQFGIASQDFAEGVALVEVPSKEP
jgi:hypothetical protein